MKWHRFQVILNGKQWIISVNIHSDLLKLNQTNKKMKTELDVGVIYPYYMRR